MIRLFFFVATDAELASALPGWKLGDETEAAVPAAEGVAERIAALPGFRCDDEVVASRLDALVLGRDPDAGEPVDETLGLPFWRGPLPGDYRVLLELPLDSIARRSSSEVRRLARLMAESQLGHANGASEVELGEIGARLVALAGEVLGTERRLYLLRSPGPADPRPIDVGDFVTAMTGAIERSDFATVLEGTDRWWSTVRSRPGAEFTSCAQPVLWLRTWALHGLDRVWEALGSALVAEALAVDRPPSAKAPPCPNDALVDQINAVRRARPAAFARGRGLGPVLRAAARGEPHTAAAPLEVVRLAYDLALHDCNAAAYRVASALLELPTDHDGLLWLAKGVASWNARRLRRAGGGGGPHEVDTPAIRRAAELLPGSAYPAFFLGIALQMERDEPSAVAAFDTAEALLPGLRKREPDATLRQWLGRVVDLDSRRILSARKGRL